MQLLRLPFKAREVRTNTGTVAPVPFTKSSYYLNTIHLTLRGNQVQCMIALDSLRCPLHHLVDTLGHYWFLLFDVIALI